MAAFMIAHLHEGALIGNNLEAHIKALEGQMRDAAADLDFETAARLRDEIKRLRETELAVMVPSSRPAPIVTSSNPAILAKSSRCSRRSALE